MMLSIMVRSLWGKGVSQNGMNFCPGDVDFQGSSPPALLACVSLHALLVSRLAGDWSTGLQICKVPGAQLLPDPAPELLHRIEVGRLGRHMPELHFAIAMGLAALCCGEEALVVAQD